MLNKREFRQTNCRQNTFLPELKNIHPEHPKSDPKSVGQPLPSILGANPVPAPPIKPLPSFLFLHFSSTGVRDTNIYPSSSPAERVQGEKPSSPRPGVHARGCVCVERERESVCVGWWAFFMCASEEDLAHTSMCLRRCRARWSEREKLRSQSAHLKGLTPVCFL